MSFLPWELLRYQSYRKETALVPLSPPSSFWVTLSSVIIWNIANFLEYLDILCSHMQEIIPGHLISSSALNKPHTCIKWGKEKALKAWKRQCLVLSFFLSNDSFHNHIIGLYNFKLSLLHQDISRISKTVLLILKSLGKHLQLRSTTFKLRKWSPLVSLCRILMSLGMGEQKFLAVFHDPKDWTFFAWGAFPTPAATTTKTACVNKDYSKDAV